MYNHTSWMLAFMSGFFSGLQTHIPNPDVVMNSGPLPSRDSSGWPVGFDGTPDGKIGAASSLLGGVQPYSYGGPARLSTQTAYLNIPHVTQRLVPALTLPRSNTGTGMFTLNHQVDDGDIAFVVRVMFSPYEMVENKRKYLRQGVIHAIDPVINLSTANYILHGLQTLGYNTENTEWHTLWVAMGLDKGCPGLHTRMMELDKLNDPLKLGNMQRARNRFIFRECKRAVATYVIRNVITPFGIPRGSEKQGGQHQGIVNKSVTWPVDLVTSMVIDGRVINMVNFWRNTDIHAGDDLMLYLDDVKCHDYVLSHHPKSTCQHIFKPLETE